MAKDPCTTITATQICCNGSGLEIDLQMLKTKTQADTAL